MDQPPPRSRTWRAKFRDALRGVGIGVLGQSSFQVHVLCAVVVAAGAAWLGMSAWQWCTLLLCITLVMMAELFNTSLEVMAKAIDEQPNSRLRDALDLASGAVFLAALGAVVVGSVVLAHALYY